MEDLPNYDARKTRAPEDDEDGDRLTAQDREDILADLYYDRDR
jgi:hypothetical protein